MTRQEPLFEVRNIKVHVVSRGSISFFKKKPLLKIVDGVSFEIQEGEILGIVGESGCGKTTLAKAAFRLLPATSGEILLEGQDILKITSRELKALRPLFQIIFQDPYSSLNPRMSVYETLQEPLKTHLKLGRREILERIEQMLECVGLSKEALHRYPHEFSGGQRQRIAIARALILNPKLVIADEPTSSLDVSVQAQILNLLSKLKQEQRFSMILISHNLAVVRHLCTRVAIMYFGKFVEVGPVDEIFTSPLHPYTRALLSSVPIPDPKWYKTPRATMTRGEPPALTNPPSGCAYHPRCPLATQKCSNSVPTLSQARNSISHQVSCFEAD